MGILNTCWTLTMKSEDGEIVRALFWNKDDANETCEYNEDNKGFTFVSLVETDIQGEPPITPPTAVQEDAQGMFVGERWIRDQFDAFIAKRRKSKLPVAPNVFELYYEIQGHFHVPTPLASVPPKGMT